jgi:O-antigen/teichoic acid export membrane protein
MTPVVLICNSLLIQYHVNGYYELGIYNATYNFSQLGAILIGVIGQVFYPLAMKNFGKGNKKFDFYNIIHSYLIGIVIFVPILILPDLFIRTYGYKYSVSSSYTTLIFVCLFSIIISHRQGIARNFVAGNFMWFSVFSNLTWAISTIIFCYLFVNKGSEGRAIAFFLGYIINSIIFIPFYINKKLITPKLIFEYFHALILFLIFFSSMVFYYLSDYICIRVFLTLFIIPLLLFIFYRWHKKYLSHV